MSEIIMRCEDCWTEIDNVNSSGTEDLCNDCEQDRKDDWTNTAEDLRMEED